MVLSFIVNDMMSVSFIINQFSHVLDGYDIERNPITGEVELLTLFIPDTYKEEAEQIKELIELYAKRP